MNDKTTKKMNPKSLLLCVAFLFMGILFVSCGKQEDDRDEMSLNISFSTRAALSDANLNHPGERVINKVRVFVFDDTSTGLQLDKNVYLDNITTDNDGVYTLRIDGVSSCRNKKIKVIINEPLSLKTALDAVNSDTELLPLQYDLGDYTTGAYIINTDYPSDFCLPMFGEADVTVYNWASPPNVDVKVDRAVARVDLKLHNGSSQSIGFKYDMSNNIGTTLDVNNITDKGYLLPSSNQMMETVGFKRLCAFYETNDFAIAAGGEDKTISFYLPARSCPDEDTRLRIRLNNVFRGEIPYNYEIVLSEVTIDGGTKELTAIERNNLYTINCYFSTQNSIQFEASVVKWEEAENTDIIM